MDNLQTRIQRLYAAVDAVTDSAVENYAAGCIVTPQFHGFCQDFSGGASTAELTNTLHSLIYNVANLHDNLRRWVSQHGGDKDSVHDFLYADEAFLIVTDLANNDRHSYPPRDGGHSKKAPRLSNVVTAARLSATKGKPATLLVGAHGVVSSAGNVERIITADVVDDQGNRLGDANAIVTKAVAHCEAALARFQNR